MRGIGFDHDHVNHVCQQYGALPYFKMTNGIDRTI